MWDDIGSVLPQAEWWTFTPGNPYGRGRLTTVDLTRVAYLLRKGEISLYH